MEELFKSCLLVLIVSSLAICDSAPIRDPYIFIAMFTDECSVLKIAVKPGALGNTQLDWLRAAVALAGKAQGQVPVGFEFKSNDAVSKQDIEMLPPQPGNFNITLLNPLQDKNYLKDSNFQRWVGRNVAAELNVLAQEYSEASAEVSSGTYVRPQGDMVQQSKHVLAELKNRFHLYFRHEDLDCD